MNTLPRRSEAEFQCRLTPKLNFCPVSGNAIKQRGVALFFTLIALVVMSLAAVALIRSVDTSTMIAGNLAFRQAGISSADAGIEAAVAWLSTTQATMQTAGLEVYENTTHVFNKTRGASGFTTAAGVACCENKGYYSNADPALSLTDGTGIVWDDNDSALVGTDSSGNTIRYVIQRMCRTADAIPHTEELPPRTGCYFSSAALNTSGQTIPYAPDVCVGSGCPSAGMTALFRITARVTGPKNTVSYTQTIVY